MRLIRDSQTTLRFQSIQPAFAKQWEKMGAILDGNPAIAELVWGDLNRTADGGTKKDAGAKGLSADQVLRFVLVKTVLGLSYRGLVDRIDDSIVMREFCHAGPRGKIPRFTTVQENVKKLRPETLGKINDLIIGCAREHKVEDGARVRIDSTAVESNIHHPFDARHLWDAVRVLTRILHQAEKDIEGLRGRFCDHTRVAKKLVYRINNARGDANRLPLYKQLIKTAQKVVEYAGVAVKELSAERCGSFEEIALADALRGALEHYIPLAERVIDQATRRILQGENVPAQEKIVSIFEPHADIIKKGQREIIYGHKIFLTGGKSNLVLDCSIERGNPADTGQFLPALERHNQRFGKVPKDVATDGGFASKDNAKKAREAGVTNIVFSALKGNVLAELVQSERLYKRLRKWRAGIEGVISTVKRAYGLVRCNWRSFESFQAYVQLAVIAYNLKTLALKLLA